MDPRPEEALAVPVPAPLGGARNGSLDPHPPVVALPRHRVDTVDTCSASKCVCVPTAEVCNGKDDDYDGKIDEDPACLIEVSTSVRSR